MIAVKTAAVIFYTAVSDVLDNKYVFWIITTAVGLLVGALTWFVKRAIDKMEKRIDEQEDKLNKTINDLPFLYTLREDFIRAQANNDRKLDQINSKLDRVLAQGMRADN